MFSGLWNDGQRGPCLVVGHKHGQKEPVDIGEQVRDTYANQADRNIVWLSAQWIGVSIGATARKEGGDPSTILATGALSASRTVLTDRTSKFFVGGSSDWRNVQSEIAPPLSREGMAVVHRLERLVSGTFTLVRSCLYSEAIHASRGPGTPTHHFDFHR